jgi:RimJ/RimL family protein N-acetyltransferase
MAAFLSDGRLDLRPVRPADLAQLASWRNDPEIRRATREWRALTEADQARWFERISAPDRRDQMFVVQRTGDQAALGVVGLSHWSAIDATAEISFYIGPPEARGQGYARASLTLLLDWGFRDMRLERVWAETYAFNSASARLLSTLGFVEEGRLRAHVFRDGRRWDSLVLGLLRDEWMARVQQSSIERVPPP